MDTFFNNLPIELLEKILVHAYWNEPDSIIQLCYVFEHLRPIAVRTVSRETRKFGQHINDVWLEYSLRHPENTCSCWATHVCSPNCIPF